MKGQFAYVFGMQFEKNVTTVQISSIWFPYIHFEVTEMFLGNYCKFASVVHLIFLGDTTDFVAQLDEKSVREYRWNNTEKLATQGIQDEGEKHNTICVGHHYAKAITNNVNNT